MRVQKLFAYLALAIFLPIWLMYFADNGPEKIEVSIDGLCFDSLAKVLAKPEKSFANNRTDSLLETLLARQSRTPRSLPKQEEVKLDSIFPPNMFIYNLSPDTNLPLRIELKPDHEAFSIILNNSDPYTDVDIWEIKNSFTADKYGFNSDFPVDFSSANPKRIPAQNAYAIQFNCNPNFRNELATFKIIGSLYNQRTQREKSITILVEIKRR